MIYYFVRALWLSNSTMFLYLHTQMQYGLQVYMSSIATVVIAIPTAELLRRCCEVSARVLHHQMPRSAADTYIMKAVFLFLTV